MKRNFVSMLMFSFVLGFQGASAQFPIKLPKIKTDKPTVEQPTSDAPKAADAVQPGATDSGQAGDYVEPQQPSTPMFLKETFEIAAKTESRYWKVPNQNDNPSWFPQVEFRIFYDDSVRQRFNAEWFNPDGTPWFTEQLDIRSSRGISVVTSPYQNESPYSKGTQAIGTFGFKIVNTKTNETVMQGKYKVKKIAYDPKIGTNGIFYVDNEWNMPVGYAGLASDDWNTSTPQPVVLMWLKGEFENKDLEARLFFNGQEIGSTDEGGRINTTQSRGGDCYLYKSTCEYKLWSFAWNKLYVGSKNMSPVNFPQGTMFMSNKPGEYTAKIFHKGVQIREAKFSVGSSGGIVTTPYSTGIYPTLSMIPVKVTGTAEKSTPLTWKADAFYGNPLPGFVMP